MVTVIEKIKEVFRQSTINYTSVKFSVLIGLKMDGPR